MKRLGVAVLCGPEGAGKSTGVTQVVKQMLATGDIKGAKFVRLHNNGTIQHQVNSELRIPEGEAFVNYIEADDSDKRLHVLVIDQIGHGQNPDMNGFDGFMEDLAVSSFNSLQDNKTFMVIAITSKIDIAKRILGLNGGVKFHPLIFGNYMLKVMKWDETQIVSFCSKKLMELFLMEDEMTAASDEEKNVLIDRYCNTLRTSISLAVRVGTPQFCIQVVESFFEIVDTTYHFIDDQDRIDDSMQLFEEEANRWVSDRRWETYSRFPFQDNT
jgi:hypothetical protein